VPVLKGLSAFAAAAITGGDPYKTTMMSWKYTLPAFLVPFMFTVHPNGVGLLLKGPWTNIILTNGWEDRSFIMNRTEGFEEFKTILDGYPPEKAAEITGIPEQALFQAAEILALNKPMAVLWAMGITQHIVGVRNVMDLANLQMLLGNIGRRVGMKN
jgi:formate dehydrogenase major subunit/formate dehydrogenase alpha subunit